MKRLLTPAGFVCVFAAAWAAACSSPTGGGEGGDSTLPGKCVSEAPGVAPQKTDILFVIDNSGSMSEEQEGIALELPAFIEELQKGGGVAQDFQVGVITTGVYQNAELSSGTVYTEFPTQSGKLQAVPVAAADGGTEPGTERVLKGSDPDLLEKFRLLVKQGITGSGQETPFEAVRLAVAASPLPAENEGFLRDGARLIVVVVTDEDDCSETARPPQVKVGTLTTRDYCTEQAGKLTPVSEYYDLFTNLKDSNGDPKVMVFAVIGPVARNGKHAQAVVDNGVIRNTDCPTSLQPGYRHRDLASRFDPSLTNLDSICRENYRDSLLTIAALANQKQSIEVSGVPDPALLKVEITRANGTVQACTLLNEGIRYEPGEVFFQNDCLRRGDDKAITVKLLCAS